MPKSFAIELPDFQAQILEAFAEARCLSPELLLSDIARSWVKHQLAVSDAVRVAMERRGEPIERPMREKDHELALAGALIARGLNVLRQVRSNRGTADLVVNNRVVVEVKLDVRSWRDVHQAQGQADAYALALKVPHALVCAPGVSEVFRSTTVCDVAEAVEVIAELCHAETVTQSAPNRH